MHRKAGAALGNRERCAVVMSTPKREGPDQLAWSASLARRRLGKVFVVESTGRDGGDYKYACRVVTKGAALYRYIARRRIVIPDLARSRGGPFGSTRFVLLEDHSMRPIDQ
jgi:hypothetical protein